MTSAKSAAVMSDLFDHSNMAHSYQSISDLQRRNGRTLDGNAAYRRPHARPGFKARHRWRKGVPAHVGLHRRNRMAFAVTSTVAPVSARIAGHRPVTPITVVTRKTAFKPRAMVMF